MMKFEILNIKALTEADFDRAFDNMSSERKTRCLRYKLMDDRRRMVFCDALLRELIKEQYSAEDNEISIISLPSGKPVAKVRGKEVFVSMSHSGDFVACAVSDTPVGIDLEVKREYKPTVYKALNEAEREFILKSKDEASAFFKVWTAKEAYVKLTGKGLAGFSKADVLPLVKNGKWDGLALKGANTEDYSMTIIYKK